MTRQLIQAAVRRKGIGRTARTLGLPRDVIHAILGDAPRVRSQRRAVADDEAAWTSREQGVTVVELAAQYQCSKRAIEQSLRRAALTLQRQTA
jgi:hypothetical protein